MSLDPAVPIEDFDYVPDDPLPERIVTEEDLQRQRKEIRRTSINLLQKIILSFDPANGASWRLLLTVPTAAGLGILGALLLAPISHLIAPMALGRLSFAFGLSLGATMMALGLRRDDHKRYELTYMGMVVGTLLSLSGLLPQDPGLFIGAPVLFGFGAGSFLLILWSGLFRPRCLSKAAKPVVPAEP